MGLLTAPLGPPVTASAAPTFYGTPSAGLFPGLAPPGAPAGPQAAAPQDLPDSAYDQGGDNPNLLDKILNRVMPTSRAYKGLLTPQEVTEARRRGLMTAGLSMLANSGPVNGQNAPGTAQALGMAGMAGMGAYDQSQQDALKQQATAAQMMQAQRVLQVRAAAQKMFAPQAGESQQDLLDRQSSLGAFLASNGDYEGAKGVAEATSPLRMARAYGAMAQNGKMPLKVVNVGGAQTVFDPNRGMYRNPAQSDENAPDAWVTSLKRTDTEDHKAEADARLAGAAANAATNAGLRNQTLDHATATSYQSRNSDGLKIIQQVGQVNSLLDQAKQGNQYATQLLPGALAGVLDPKARVGPSILAKVSTYDPSIVGRIAQYRAQNFQGTIPPADLALIQRAVTAVYQARAQHLGADYDQTVKGRPGAATFLGTKASLFAVPALEGAGGAPAAGGGAGYSADNPFTRPGAP